MTTRAAALLTVPFLLALPACPVPPDPTSSAALVKAPPFQWGSSCVLHLASSYGSASSDATTPICLDDEDCDALSASSATASADGQEHEGGTYYSDPSYFEGTCENAAGEVPVSCADRVPQNDCDVCQYGSCCVSVALCADDPDCSAINDCVNACANDQECAAACLANGNDSAGARWQSAIACIDAACAASCG